MKIHDHMKCYMAACILAYENLEINFIKSNRKHVVAYFVVRKFCVFAGKFARPNVFVSCFLSCPNQPR